MKDKKLLIVGLDPGITIGYAILDIDGNLIHVDSSKQLGLDRLISESIKFGRVVLAGTDKHKIPRLVREFSTKLGARVVSPEEDIKVDEKRKMTYNFTLDNEHQSDALASALFAYKSAKPLLDKIDFFVEEHKKHDIKDKLKEIVLTRQISIRNAAAIIEKKEDENKLMEKVVMEKKLEEKDFLRLYSKLKDYEVQIRHLRNYGNSLKKKLTYLEKIKSKEVDVQTIYKATDFREKRIKSLENIIKAKENDLEHLRNLLKRFNVILSNINDFYVLKKVNNLGIGEFNLKNKRLDIRKNDILLVEDPNIISREVLEFLKDRVFVMVHKKPVNKKIERDLPFIFIASQNLSIEEDKYFGFIDKRQFEAEKSKIDWVKKIVEDYKNEKLVSR